MINSDKIHWIKNHPTFCIAPYRRYDFRESRQKFVVTCCCNLDTEISGGDLDSIDKLKDQFRQNQKPSACWRCYQEEEQGNVSERMRDLIALSHEDLELFQSNGETKDFIIGVKFSNLCNLACRSCNSDDSSTFFNISKNETFSRATQDVALDADKWDLLTAFVKQKFVELKNFKDLVILPIGGETLLQPGFLKLMQWLVDEQMAGDITVAFQSSFSTPLSKKQIDLLQQFKFVTICVSVDSVGDNYHHVRWPSTFSKFNQNFETAVSFLKENIDKTLLILTPTLSINNIFYMKNFLDWWEKWFEMNPQILRRMHSIHVHTPTYLSIDLIPDPYREKLSNQLEQCLVHNIFKADQGYTIMPLQVHLSAILDNLKNTKLTSDQEFKNYLKYSAIYDKKTKSDSFAGNKQFFDLLTPEHVRLYQHYFSKSDVTLSFRKNIDQPN
jgi:hypothetical protein